MSADTEVKIVTPYYSNQSQYSGKYHCMYLKWSCKTTHLIPIFIGLALVNPRAFFCAVILFLWAHIVIACCGLMWHATLFTTGLKLLIHQVQWAHSVQQNNRLVYRAIKFLWQGCCMLWKAGGGVDGGIEHTKASAGCVLNCFFTCRTHADNFQLLIHFVHISLPPNLINLIEKYTEYVILQSHSLP